MNTVPKNPKLLLWNVFSRLRTELNLPVGVDEYHLLLQALQMGYGWENRDHLARLCETIWLKSPDHRSYLRKVLDEIIGKEIAEIERLEAEKKPIEPPKPIEEQKPSEEKPPEKSEAIPPEKNQSQTPAPLQEERAQVETEAIGQVLNLDWEESPGGRNEVLNTGFILDDSYLPLSVREMKQSWRFLRNPVQSGYSDEIDIPATVKNIARDGMFTELVFHPSVVNKSHLLLLLDHGGSMAAFDLLADRLVESARQGGGHPDAEVYYFRNHPQGYLYKNRNQVEGFARTRIWLKNRSPYTSVLIFSDAGAARGNFNPLRVQETTVFLRELKSFIGKITWLNPVPAYRWPGTTAEEIAKQVPMYEWAQTKLSF
ncbi:MAG: hypothetical protein SF052_05325 [Bacteroidia bacterium]|nr:hypothetical protein [Bacteroidia bacterium]